MSEFLSLQINLAAEQNFAHDGKDSAVSFCNVFPIRYGIKIAEPLAKLKPMTLNAEYWQRDRMETQLYVSGKSRSGKEDVCKISHYRP